MPQLAPAHRTAAVRRRVPAPSSLLKRRHGMVSGNGCVRPARQPGERLAGMADRLVGLGHGGFDVAVIELFARDGRERRQRRRRLL